MLINVARTEAESLRRSTHFTPSAIAARYNTPMVFRYFLQNALRQTAQQAMQNAAAGGPPLPPHCDILVAMALSAESGGLVDRLSDVTARSGTGFVERVGYLGETIVDIVETGLGCARAAKAVTQVIAQRQPQWVISAGFAGGLADGMKRNHFLMADAVIDESSGAMLDIGLTMDKQAVADSPGVHVGRLLTVDRLIHDPVEKRKLGQQHHALACDMESFAVVEACAALHVRCLSVRIISDGVDDALPKEIERLMAQESTAAKLGAAAAALWNRPSSAKDMWALQEEALVASDKLAKFLLGVMRQLPIEKRELDLEQPHEQGELPTEE
jgi:adenosylhomocysteine nucleosidase